jgi:uncharacterized protein (TIGR03067 family)
MRWIPLLLLLGFTSATVAAPIPKEVKFASDAQRILGKWQSEFLSRNGADQQPDASSTFRFKADGKCGLRDNDDPDSEFTLDTGSSPRRMKWLHGPQKTEWCCLYELDDDTLRIAFINSGTEIPAKLEPSQNATIYYLKRIKE